MTTARMSRLRAAFTMLTVAALLSACTPTEIRRAGDDITEEVRSAKFYLQPQLLPEGSPGDLIRSERILGTPDGAEAWRIMFHSTDVFGKPVVNTGLVVAPTSSTPEGGRTVVSWGHPTTGSAIKCSPSSGLDPFDLVEGLNDFLDRGYAVTYTDYTGMGTAGPNSYLVGETAGRNMLDAARAARSLLKEEASSRVVLWGHSQGGQGALFAGQIATSYAPDLDVRAVAVAAPATNLAKLLDADIGDVSGVSIGAYAFNAYAEVYGDSVSGAELDTILTPAAIAALPSMVKLCLLGQNDELHAIGKPLVGGFLTADPATTEPWATLLADNTAGAVPLNVPLFVAQGETDTLVDPQATTSFVAHERSQGVDVTYEEITNTGHGLVALRALKPLMKWLEALGADEVAGPGSLQ